VKRHLIIGAFVCCATGAFAQTTQQATEAELELFRTMVVRNGCVLSSEDQSGAAFRASGLSADQFGRAFTVLLQTGEIVVEADGMKLKTGACK